MQKIIALALAATVFGLPLATPGYAVEDNANLCGPDAPAAYQRAGGFCEQLKDTKSLASYIQDEDYFVILED